MTDAALDPLDPLDPVGLHDAMTPSGRDAVLAATHDDLAKAERLDEAIAVIAAIARHRGYREAAQEVLDAWQAFGDLLEDRCTCPSNEACVPCGLPSVPGEVTP